MLILCGRGRGGGHRQGRGRGIIARWRGRWRRRHRTGGGGRRRQGKGEREGGRGPSVRVLPILLPFGRATHPPSSLLTPHSPFHPLAPPTLPPTLDAHIFPSILHHQGPPRGTGRHDGERVLSVAYNADCRGNGRSRSAGHGFTIYGLAPASVDKRLRPRKRQEQPGRFGCCCFGRHGWRRWSRRISCCNRPCRCQQGRWARPTRWRPREQHGQRPLPSAAATVHFYLARGRGTRATCVPRPAREDAPCRRV